MLMAWFLQPYSLQSGSRSNLDIDESSVLEMLLHLGDLCRRTPNLSHSLPDGLEAEGDGVVLFH